MKAGLALKIQRELLALGNIEKAKSIQRFFKTAPGEYGENDRFLGIGVPDIRKLAQKYFKEANYSDIKVLLDSKWHEERFLALIIITQKFTKKDNISGKDELVQFYLANLKAVNNWDLVDVSCYKILGSYLLQIDDFSILFDFAKSSDLWKRRISIVTSYAFIRKSIFQPTIDIANILLTDKEDLIHKAVGWMLREVGKKSPALLIAFLDKNALIMPRTMLRYSIEKFNQSQKKHYLLLK
ncbi:MAG: DNA alkylation repair protein [SAR324 cluster bacterium]|nr:DNA alkylation repair protein [SAR324 cluster bacterium]